jgi:hypothetical protein
MPTNRFLVVTQKPGQHVKVLAAPPVTDPGPKHGRQLVQFGNPLMCRHRLSSKCLQKALQGFCWANTAQSSYWVECVEIEVVSVSSTTSLSPVVYTKLMAV